MAINKVEAMCPVISTDPNNYCRYKGFIQLSEEVQFMSTKEQNDIIREAGKRLNRFLRNQHEDGKHEAPIKRGSWESTE